MTLPTSHFLNQIVCGDCLEMVRQLPDDAVDTVVTSPPYYQQRDYGSKQQIGQEPTIDEYTRRLAELFVELRRVVKPTGSA